MNKMLLREQILQHFDDDIEAAIRAANEAQAAAAHEDNQPENQYDTLSLEAAYLAHGQSERTHQLQQQRILMARWQVVDFSDDDEISLGALVTLESGDNLEQLWLTPVSGITLTVDDQTIRVISPDTPLASMLIGKGVDDEIQWLGTQNSWTIVAVQ